MSNEELDQLVWRRGILGEGIVASVVGRMGTGLGRGTGYDGEPQVRLKKHLPGLRWIGSASLAKAAAWEGCVSELWQGKSGGAC